MDARKERENRAKPALLAALAAAALFLLSCGEESPTTAKPESVPKAATASDLDSCGADNLGDRVFVEDERMLYTCGEEGWKAAVEPAEYDRECGDAVVSNDSVSTCGEDGTFRDSRAGRVYKCVKIGDQTWMAENLDFGEQVHHDGTQVHASAAHAQKYCYGDDSTNCAKYGGLYQWHTAMGLCAEYAAMDASDFVGTPHRGICPAGWHVPTKEEWETLVEFVQSPDSNDAGRKLKSKTGWDERQNCAFYGSLYVRTCQDYATGVNGIDAYGWNALPGGFLGDVSIFIPGTGFPGNSYESHEAEFSEDADEFWTATESGSNIAMRYVILALADSVKSGAVDKAVHSARSIRCVQD